MVIKWKTWGFSVHSYFPEKDFKYFVKIYK